MTWIHCRLNLKPVQNLISCLKILCIACSDKVSTKTISSSRSFKREGSSKKVKIMSKKSNSFHPLKKKCFMTRERRYLHFFKKIGLNLINPKSITQTIHIFLLHLILCTTVVPKKPIKWWLDFILGKTLPLVAERK